jgi:hypothetical protein
MRKKMKKLFSLLIMGLLLISMVSAVATNVADDDVEKRNIDGGKEPKINYNLTEEDEELEKNGFKVKGFETEEIEVEDEEEKPIKEMKQEREMKQEKIGEEEIESEVEIETDAEGKVKAKLSNGKNVTVKIMPSTASEKAIAALSLHNCVEAEGCTIQFKEVGNGNETKAAYEVKTQKEVKFLGLFKAQMKVEAQINAENGEVIKTKKAWWGFLASENSKKNTENSEQEVEVEETETEVEEVETEEELIGAINPTLEPTAEAIPDAR